MPYYFNLALDDGVKPREISEIITHLAFYVGWPNAFSALPVAKEVFAKRRIGSDQLPAASPRLMPLDEAAEAERATRVDQQFGSVVPGIVQYTPDLLFCDLWLRPDLAPRDRSLVTVSALIASGQVAQIPYHLNRAMNNGLTQAEAAEAITPSRCYRSQRRSSKNVRNSKPGYPLASARPPEKSRPSGGKIRVPLKRESTIRLSSDQRRTSRSTSIEGDTTMGTIKVSEDINHHRRRFLGTAMGIAAAQLGMLGTANAQAGRTHRRSSLRSGRERIHRSAR